MIGKRLSRRAMLRGLGTSIALPFLDSMVPAFAAPSKVAGGAPTRIAFVYVPNGIHMPDWTPPELGASFSLPKTLEPIAPFRDELMVLSGLTHNTGRALGDGPGDHARAAATFLTGVHPKKTFGADIKAGVSADQVAAQAIGKATRFASLELGCEDGRQVGNCDSGYSCAYSNSISWRTESTPNPPEVNPRLVFERLFGGIDATESQEARAKRELYSKSILDFVSDDTRKLQGELGATDRRKLDEYLHAVREIEQRIESSEKESNPIIPAIEAPAGVPVEFADHVRLMFDLLTIALQTDMTRVATFMVAREGSNRPYREIGIPDGHHSLTHHRNDAAMIEKVAKINRLHMEQFAYFLNRMKATPDGDGTLLDHSMIVYGSGLSDGNRHQHNDLPVLVAGRANGALHPGRHIRYAAETPMTNLYLAMLDKAGVKPETIGDSNGRLDHLSEL
jgi:hypothetical protein